MRDHGKVADIAHTTKSLSAKQRAFVSGAAKAANGLAHYAKAADAFFPLLPRGRDISPLLPFYVAVDNATPGRLRAVAVANLRHVPYDSIAVVTEQVDGDWRIRSITSVVDH